MEAEMNYDKWPVPHLCCIYKLLAWMHPLAVSVWAVHSEPSTTAGFVFGKAKWLLA